MWSQIPKVKPSHMYRKETNGENLVSITNSRTRIWLNFAICYLIIIKSWRRVFSRDSIPVWSTQILFMLRCQFSFKICQSNTYTFLCVCFLSFCLSFLICTYQITKQHRCRGYSCWNGNGNKTTECKAPPVDRSDVRTVRWRQHNGIVLDSIGKYEASICRLEMMEWD